MPCMRGGTPAGCGDPGAQTVPAGGGGGRSGQGPRMAECRATPVSACIGRQRGRRARGKEGGELGPSTSCAHVEALCVRVCDRFLRAHQPVLCLDSSCIPLCRHRQWPARCGCPIRVQPRTHAGALQVSGSWAQLPAVHGTLRDCLRPPQAHVPCTMRRHTTSTHTRVCPRALWHGMPCVWMMTAGLRLAGSTAAWCAACGKDY